MKNKLEEFFDDNIYLLIGIFLTLGIATFIKYLIF